MIDIGIIFTQTQSAHVPLGYLYHIIVSLANFDCSGYWFPGGAKDSELGKK